MEDFFDAWPARSCRQADWAKERKLWMPPLISFETGRKHKPNLLFKTTRWSETANGSLVLIWKKEPRLRGQHTRREIRKSFVPALLRSASGELLPSWQRPIMEVPLSETDPPTEIY